MEEEVPAWVDPNLPPPKVGRILYGEERQKAIDTFMYDLITEQAETVKLEGWLVEYVNSYRRRRHGSRARRKPLTEWKKRA